jgi:hypothetical protein
MEIDMKQLALAALLSIFALGSALADDTCQSKAVGKDGKPLAGAALKSFMTKCTKDACEPKAVDKNGKPLAGAAKTSFMKKCESEAKATTRTFRSRPRRRGRLLSLGDGG